MVAMEEQNKMEKKQYITVKIEKETLERYNLHKKVGMTWTEVLKFVMDKFNGSEGYL